MAIAELKNVSRVYESGDHELKALDDVNVSFEEGKFVVILGPSGAGKSTLLNLLGGAVGRVLGLDEVLDRVLVPRVSAGKADDIVLDDIKHIESSVAVPEHLTGQGGVILARHLRIVAVPRGRVRLDDVDRNLRRVVPGVVNLAVEGYVRDVRLAGLTTCHCGSRHDARAEKRSRRNRGHGSQKFLVHNIHLLIYLPENSLFRTLFLL